MREMKKLGELGDVFIGLTYKPEDVVDEDGTIVLRSSNIQDGKLDFGDIVRVSCNIRDKLWVKENDILMCSRNGSAKLVGKTALISNLQEDMTFGAFMTIIRTPYNGYLQYFFKSPMFRRQLNSSATTTINQITRSMLDNIDVPVFDNDTADNIKAILGKCEKIIQERKVEINALDDLIKARFVELFGDAIHNDKGWETDTVEKLCKEIYGGGTPSKSHPEYYEDGNIPWVSSKDMKTDVLTDSQIKINQLGVDNSTARMVPVNSVIMVIRSGILKHTLPVSINAVPITVNQDLKVFIPNERVLTRFLAVQFKMHEKDILSGVRAVTADNIEFNSLKKRELIVPPIELQQEYVTFLERIDKSKVAVQKALDETQILFDSLMQKFFG